ncbi:MAG: MFS transporter [Gammaproteobacteria bacterium]|nr:MFS transporter [Gammaproteobacteria bacterium]
MAIWYGSYLLLGAAMAGLFAIMVPLAIVAITHDSRLVAYVIGAYNAGLLLSPAWGLLAERSQDYRPIFLGGFAVAAMGLVGLSLPLAPPFWVLAALIVGIGTGAASTVASLFVLDFAPRDEWEPRLGWLQSFNGAGVVAGLLLAGLWTHDPTLGIQIAAILMLAAAILGAYHLPVSRTPRTPRPGSRHLDWRALAAFGHSELSGGNVLHHMHIPIITHLKEMHTLIQSRFGRFLLSWATLSFAVAAFFAYFPLLLRHVFAIRPAVTALSYAIVAAAAIGLYIVASRWCSRYGAMRVYRLSLLARASGFGLLWALMLIPGAAQSAPALIGFGIIVIAWPALSVSGTVLTGQLTPTSEGAAIGLFNAATALATVAGTFAGGPLVAHFGYAAVLAIGLGGLIVAWFLFTNIRAGSPTSVASPPAPGE